MRKKVSSESNELGKYSSFAAVNPALFVNPSSDCFRIEFNESEIRRIQEEQAQQLEKEGLPRDWAQVGVVYEDQYFLILRDAVRFPDGQSGTYVRIVVRTDNVPGVAVLPFCDGKVVLVRHFRHATRDWHLEIPRGFGTKGLSSEENARRELAEETGAVVSRIVSLGPMHVNTGMTSEWVELFHAEVESLGEPESKEAITELRAVELLEFEHLMGEGQITDSFTLAAYTRARLRGVL